MEKLPKTEQADTHTCVIGQDATMSYHPAVIKGSTICGTRLKLVLTWVGLVGDIK